MNAVSDRDLPLVLLDVGEDVGVRLADDFLAGLPFTTPRPNCCVARSGPCLVEGDTFLLSFWLPWFDITTHRYDFMS